MNYFEIENGNLLFKSDGETLMIEPWGENSFRIRSCILGSFPESIGALEEQKKLSCEIKTENTSATITNGKIQARLNVDSWRENLQISFYDKNGHLLLREISPGGSQFLKARNFKALQGGNYALKVSFESNAEEKIYGMGQYQQEILNLKGCHLELAHRNSQASIPFYISSLGYGFLWNNPAIGEVFFGENKTQWTAHSTKCMDYWITAGDSPAEIEESYANVTGKVPMMPEYGLGFWQCKLRYHNEEEVLKVANEYHKRNIPLDVLIIDYYHWPRCGDFRFDEEYFPHPTEMVQKLKEMGIETMVSVWPQVDYRSENYSTMKQQGLLVKSNTGVDVQMLFHGNNVFMDPTNPKTREFVWNKCKQHYADLGIRTFWLDEAEPEYTTYDFDNYRYYSGPVAETGNIYPREYARLFFDGLSSLGETNIVNLIRCAWAGSQKYGALVWSGDIMSTYEDFRKQICVGLHMGLSGIPWWTTDIGGFHGGNIHDPDFKELLIRWFQFGTFCPVMRLHGFRQPSIQIINQYGEERECSGADNEIWSYGEENYEIMLKFIHIRESMRDYIRSLMQQAHEKGTPIIRTLFYEFPEDSNCWDIKDSYMFGEDILVAPICRKNATKRWVYLPGNTTWVHAGTGKQYEGGQTLEISAEIDTIPVFLKEGRQSYLIGKI